MNNLTSEYTIDLQIKDDNSKDAIRALEKGLKEVGDIAKKSVKNANMTKNLEESQKAAQEMIGKFHEMARNYELDFESISKAYSKSSKKAIDELEKQYVAIKEQKSEIEKLEAELNRQIENNAPEKERIEAATKLAEVYQRLNISSVKELDSKIKQNREIRAGLKAAEQSARLERANAKYEKLKELQAKRSAEKDKTKQKALDEEIKKQKALIKSIELAEKAQQSFTKQQEAVTKSIQASEKAQSRFSRYVNNAKEALQTVYNATGLVGGAGRLLSGGVHAASAGFDMVSQASNKALEREQAANRIKGVDSEKASAILGDVYIRTGADYSTIVDAINRVQSVLKSNDLNEISQAAALEVRYPGMTLAFASSETGTSLNNFNAYANRMRAVQKASGANDEQIRASAQKMANYKPDAFNNASVTELQAIYLGLQNSGAFESDDELDRAFDRFVRDRRGSDNAAWKDAQNYDWTKTMAKSRDKLQIANTLQKTMNWEGIRTATATKDTTTPEQTAAEKNAERMRKLEERRNEMMIKLVDIIEPIVDAMFKTLNNQKIKRLIDGVIKFFTDAVPVLADVILKIADYFGVAVNAVEAIEKQNERQTQRQVEAAESGSTASIIASRSGLDRTMRFANGGIALGPSLVGEMGPEAIIPLDYSRAQRAENIAYSIQNNFSMSGNQTTALALAEAVSSRDFSRAMGRAAFKAGRLGAF